MDKNYRYSDTVAFLIRIPLWLAGRRLTGQSGVGNICYWAHPVHADQNAVV